LVYWQEKICSCNLEDLYQILQKYTDYLNKKSTTDSIVLRGPFLVVFKVVTRQTMLTEKRTLTVAHFNDAYHIEPMNGIGGAAWYVG
jgi:hypothetical protein